MKFYVVDVADGHEFGPYETPELAEIARRALMTAEPSRKFRIKKIGDLNWRDREQRRLDLGEYVSVPWLRTDWWYSCQDIWEDHFPHVSLKHPGKMAYTENADKGQADVQTPIKPSRYLARFFGDVLKERGLDVRDLAAEFERKYAPRELRIATTADEIVRVYENGPSSCMAGHHSWPDDVHPVTIYAHGDLAVAYIHDDDKSSHPKIVARSLIWPEKKTHSRVYGDIARMKVVLGAAGYSFAPPIGAKLSRILPSRTDSVFIAPYIDAGKDAGHGALAVLDRGDHLVICESVTADGFECNCTNGLSADSDGDAYEWEDDGPDYYCDRCEDGCDETWTVFVSRRQTREWCRYCRDDHSFYCERTGNSYSEDDVGSTEVGGQTWSDYAAEDDAVLCEITDTYWPAEDTVTLADGRVCCNDEFRRRGFECSECLYKMLDDHEEVPAVGFSCEACIAAEGALHEPSVCDVVTPSSAAATGDDLPPAAPVEATATAPQLNT